MTDSELLRQFVHSGSQVAFAQIVRRHVDIVYSAARRQTRDAAAAEEVTQQVFILLAQKARTLSDDVLLGGWLFNTVRFIARDVVRKEQRRALHEQKAAQMAQHVRETSQPHNTWNEAETVLDEAMADLDEPTRGLLVLKFFEGRTAREVGERLGISEEAARKRVSRAVDELRALFARRGVVMSGAVLSEALVANAVTAAPAHLAASAASAATASLATSGPVGVGVTLVAAGKAKFIGAIVASIVAISGLVAVAPPLVRSFAPRQRTVSVPLGPMLTGVVRDASGKPVADAEVLIGSPQYVIGAYDRPRRGARINKTAADGKFSIPQPKGIFLLVVRGEQGYAEVSNQALGKSTDVTIRAWGRIEGTLLAGDKPMANTPVRLWAARGPEQPHYDSVYHQTDARTDATGKFVFPRVAPGEVWLSDCTPNGERTLRRYYFVVDPGETKNVTLGGSGRAVVGKIVAPPLPHPIWNETGRYTYDADLRPWPYDKPATSRPVHAENESFEQFRAIEEAFGETPAGQEFKTWLFGWNFAIQPDGSFRIDDLPPGQYLLQVRNLELQSEVNFLEDWARTHTRITVPQDGDAPVDVGELALEIIPRLKPGELATPFDFVTLDGTTKNITDYRGRHVLLISWAAWGDEEEMTRLTNLQKRWKDDPRLAIIWLSGEGEPQAREGAKQRGITGTVATMLPGGIPQEYGASMISSILIDPQGRIVQRHLHREFVEKYVNKSIGNPPPPVTAQDPKPTGPVLQTVPAL